MDGATSGGTSGEVRVRFRFRPIERIVFTLLFDGLCRFLTVAGAVLVAISFLPGVAGFRPVLFWLGAPWVVGCVWQPYLGKIKSVEMSYTATTAGFEWEIEDSGQGRAGWRAFRGTRHVAGALLLQQQVGCPPIYIPSHAFGPGQRDEFDRLLRAGLSSNGPAVDVVPTDAGDPLLSFRTRPPDYWTFVRIRANEVNIAATALLAGIWLVLAVVSASEGSREWAIGLIAMAAFAVALPWIGSIIAVASRCARLGYEVVVYRAGYRTIGVIDDWAPWTRYDRAVETPESFTLYLAGRRRHVHIWTEVLTEAEREHLRSVLAKAHLGRQAAPESAPTMGSSDLAASRATTRCQNCGYSRTPPGKTVCYNCGRPLAPGSPDQRIDNPQGDANPLAAAVACQNCGYSRTPPGKTVCYNCGRRIDTPIENEPAAE